MDSHQKSPSRDEVVGLFICWVSSAKGDEQSDGSSDIDAFAVA